MHRLRRMYLRLPTLGDRFNPQNNGMGFLRLAFAVGVLISHSWTLGFAQPGLGWLGVTTHAQFNTLTVYGFFIMSGYLITDSGLRSRPLAFIRNRCLRILPGL